MQQLNCTRCGTAAKRYGAQALYCLPCSNKRRRIAAPDRSRNGNYQPLKLDGQWACVDCRGPVAAYPNRRPPLRCHPCKVRRYRAMAPVGQRAAAAVAGAIRRGLLRRPSEFSCTDCGKPATCYDHRDYTKPLDVQPVCRSCNVMRGPADIWPELVTDEFPAPQPERAEAS